jgi:hypothetical protein
MHVQIDYDIGRRVWFLRDIDVKKVGFYDEDVAHSGTTKVLITGTVSKILFEGQKSDEGTESEVRYVIDTGSAQVIVNSKDISRNDSGYPSLLLGDLDEAETNLRNPSRNGEPIKADSEEEIKI